VHELVNNLLAPDFRATWQDLEVDRLFERVLERVRPDLVHVQHLMYLSAGIVERARARGVPVVMPLHEFWLQCARFGQRVDADGALCAPCDLGRCGTCLARCEHAPPAGARWAAPWIAPLATRTGIDLASPARRV